ncbi:MAG: glycosyltransferase family 4 protein [Geminicoccaceae bacterium]
MGTTGSLVFALSADYARRTGGWVYDQQLADGLAGRGWQVERLTLPAGFPNPEPAARAATAAALRALPDGTLLLSDQLCLSVLPDLMAAEADRLRLVMVLHHPLAQEGDGRIDRASPFFAGERNALAAMRLVVATSATTARTLQETYDVPAGRIVVAPPGTERRAAVEPEEEDDVRLTALGALVPRKDHPALVAALAGLQRLPWRLRIVGDTARAPAYVQRLRAQVADSGLADRILILGELDDDSLERLWQGTDIAVSASRHEGYGMALAEAVARGVPVVTTAAGAVTDWLDGSAARIVPVGDTAALQAALAEVIGSDEVRARLREGALRLRAKLPDWPDTAAAVDAALRRLVQEG